MYTAIVQRRIFFSEHVGFEVPPGRQPDDDVDRDRRGGDNIKTAVSDGTSPRRYWTHKAQVWTRSERVCECLGGGGGGSRPAGGSIFGDVRFSLVSDELQVIWTCSPGFYCRLVIKTRNGGKMHFRGGVTRATNTRRSNIGGSASGICCCTYTFRRGNGPRASFKIK